MGWGVRIGDVCLEHSYCTIPHSHCKLAICHCNEGFIPTMQNTQCSGKNGLYTGMGGGDGVGVRIGDVCLEHSYCTIPHSHCKLAICHCNEGFIPTKQNAQCSDKNGLYTVLGGRG